MRELEQQAMAAAGMQSPVAGEDGPGQSADGMANNAIGQSNGASGHAPSTPGPKAGRQNPRREGLDEANSGASGGQQGSREATGGQYRTIMGEDESEIARVVREFWEDPCNRDRFCSVESMQRLDKQCMIEGNAFVVLRRQKEGCPSVAVWPTHAVHTVIVDDLADGTGIELGFVVAPPGRAGGSWASPSVTGPRTCYPSMVADNVERLKKVLAAHKVHDVVVDEDVRVYHSKEWGPLWRPYGLPGIMASLNSAVRYMSYTSEWVIMQRVWRTYAMLITGYGQNKGLNQIQGQFANRIAGLFAGSGALSEQNGTGMARTPPAGLAALSGMSPTGMGSTRIEPIRTSGSTDPPAMGREIRLLAEMGVGYPDNMFSDTNTGTMSRADVLERNTHLKFLSAQQNYGEMMKCISRCVVMFSLGEQALKDVDVVVTWPAIVMPSVMEQAGTLIQIYQSDGMPKKLFVEECLKLLRRTDLHEVMQMLFASDEEGMELKSDEDARKMAENPMMMAGADGMGGGSPPASSNATESELLSAYLGWDEDTLLG